MFKRVGIMIDTIRLFFCKPFFSNERNLIVIYITVCILISLKIVFLETCDNYDCFKASHFHLIKNLDLYLSYPKEYHTEYNYSPFFAVFMGLFAYLPNWLGIFLWNGLHTIPFLFAIHKMPVTDTKKRFLYVFCLLEFITAAENVQTNATVTAFIMLVLIFQQKGKTTTSSFFFVFGSFFKIYVLTAGVFFLCYKKKGDFIWKSIAWGLLFFLMPLLVISWDQLLFLYQSWFTRLQAQAVRDALSLLGIINKHISTSIPQEWVILTGTITMLLVLLKKQVHESLQYRLLYLAGILLFTVVFNPGVESPSYIIAVTGAAIWYINKPRVGWEKWLMIILFVFTCLSPTDIFPKFIREEYFTYYHVKAIPVIIVWAVCIKELFLFKSLSENKIV